METPKPYTTTPRYIPDDVRSGKMTRPEWRVYQWLRINADPYGKVSASFTGIRDDIYEGTSANYINTILLSLKSKNYLRYEARRGQRGSFNIYFGDWLTPGKGIKHLDNSLGSSLVRTSKEEDKKETTGRGQTLSDANQKLFEQKMQIAQQFSPDSNRIPVRSPYNDTDTHKDNKSTLGKEAFKGTLVKDYEPKNGEEFRCQEIARDVGEQSMNPLLHVLRTHGISIIERAWGIYREDIRSGKKIDKPPAYLQAVIKNQLRKAYE